ncbi:MAG TPA: hypothetical protein VG937_11355 [Polyangiaceae bacterium]|nr:hypothetical protein [Polyangiaceae bacterium]
MRILSSTGALVGSCALALFASSCSKVMGIGEAELDPTFTETGAGGLGNAGGRAGDCETGPKPGVMKTHLQIINGCTGSQCVPFDDELRLAHLNSDGSLPPLPVAGSSSK